MDTSFFERNLQRMIELQRLLTAVPAVAPESGGKGEAQKAEILKNWLRGTGFPPIGEYKVPDSRVPGGFRPNLSAAIPGKDRTRALWIMTHLDVVPPGDTGKWRTDPFSVKIEDDRLIGRGVEDNQQGLVSSIFAALFFIERGVVPPCDLKLLIVSDEETASEYGIKYLLKHHDLFGPDDVVLVPDGGSPDGTQIEVAEKSLLWLKFTITGRQCHASRPDQGINAFVAGSDLAVRLAGLKDRFPGTDDIFDPPFSTFEPTRKDANVPNINTIPGEDVFYLDGRVLPSVPVDDVLAEIDRISLEVGNAYGVGIRREIVQRVESRATPADAGFVKVLARAVKSVYGVDAVPVGIGGGTVAAYLRNAGLTTVVWSRIDETAHMPNEYCLFSNLTGDAAVMCACALAM